MVEFREEFLSKWYGELTVDERKSIWLKYFSIPEVEEVLANVTLDEMCADEFLEDRREVYIKFTSDVDAYDEALEREDKLISFIEGRLTQFDAIYNEGMCHIALRDILPGYKNNSERYDEVSKCEGFSVIYRKQV